MGIRLEDLPAWAQAQAMEKMARQGTGGAGRTEMDKGGKYGNIRTERPAPQGGWVDFDSKKEARRYDELMARLGRGEIRELKLQPQFTLQEAYTTPEGQRVRAIRYQADFSYEEKGYDGAEDVWKLVVEDVKSQATKTRVYGLKKKLLRQKFGIDIREI